MSRRRARVCRQPHIFLNSEMEAAEDFVEQASLSTAPAATSRKERSAMFRFWIALEQLLNHFARRDFFIEYPTDCARNRHFNRKLLS